MALSFPQRQALTAIERDLSAEPVLQALVALFAEAPPPRRTAAPAARPAGTPRRCRHVALVAALAAVAGAGEALVAGLLGSMALVATGVLVVVLSVVVLAASVLGADRRPARRPEPGMSDLPKEFS